MCHRTRQESTTPRLRFSYDLTVARSQVKVTFANTHLPRAVLFAHHEHTITPLERSSRTIRTWFRSDSDLLEHREHEYSRFIVRLELEARRNNSVVTVLDTVTPDIPLAGSRSSPPSFSGACSVPGSQAHRRHCSRGLQIWNLSSKFSQRVLKVAWCRTRLRSCRLGESPPSPASSRPTILE